jgi:predicted MFS family arabinose efflux permease
MQSAKTNSSAAAAAFDQLAVAWLTMFVVGSDLFLVSPLLPLIAADYQLPPAQAGWSVTVFAATYMLSAPLLGHIADRVGRARVLTCCLYLFATANLSTALAGNFAWLLITRIAAGAAAAGVSPSVYALIGAGAPPERRASRLAIVVSGLLMSLSLGTPAGLLTAAWLCWPAVFFVLSAVSLPLAWANHRIWLHSPTPVARAATVERLAPPLLAARLAPTVLWSAALYSVYTYLGEGLSASGYSIEEIARVVLFYGGGAMAGTLLGGRIADRLGAQPAISISLLGLCSSLLLLLTALKSKMFVSCAFGLASLSAQLFFPAQQLRLANQFPSSRAAVLAWNNSALFLGISLGSLIGGQAIGRGGYDFDVVIAATVALVGWISHHDGRRQTEITLPHRRFGARAS